VTAEGRAAVFLDRDGTVIEERNYLSDPADVRLLPGAAAAIRTLRAHGLVVVLVTNQSGIARGLFGEADFRAVQARLEFLLHQGRAEVDGTYYCPHHPDFTGPCECRKPATGMYRTAARDLHLSLERSWFVGDKASDVEPAARFGGEGVLVRTGHGHAAAPSVPGGVSVVDDLAAAAALIVQHGGRSG